MESSPDGSDDERLPSGTRGLPPDGPDPSENGRPLLIESVPGEPGEKLAVGIGQTLVFLGGVTVLAYILLAVLAGPSLGGDWGGVWYRPGPQIDPLPVIALVVMFAGLALYFAGRGRIGRRS